ncbi:MAG: BCCT family transporter [Blautia sp.]
MAGMTSADKSEDESGEQRSPVYLKIFWGAAIALFGYALLLSGGLDQVQRSVVMLGLPVLAILIVNAVGFIKAVTHREIYDLTLTEEEKKKLIEER